MKTSRFLLLALCAVTLCAVVLCEPGSAQPQAKVQDKPALEVSDDNFVSLKWTRTGGFAGIHEEFLIQEKIITKQVPREQDRSAPLSGNQFDSLIRALKKVKIPGIVGNYEQKGLADGFGETLELTLSDEKDHDQTFTVSNYGDKAPKSYYAFTAYLTEMLGRKFAPLPAPEK